MQEIEKGNLDTRTLVRSNDEVGYLEQSLNTMCERLDDYIDNVYVYEIKTKTAELRALQAQIDPHFLFNTLESIRVTAQLSGAAHAAKMIHILGNLFRWNIQIHGMFVDLKEEVDYVSSYIDLEKLRYDNFFQVDVDIGQDALSYGVPKLILQPLVENAIQHGVKEVGGLIGIKGYLSGGDLNIEVSDNGKGIDEDTIAAIISGLDKDKNESIALSNIHQRISMLFGPGYGLSINSELGKGAVINIKLPAFSKEEMGKYVQSTNRR
jgi:two-component system sensor histidine kinase YesM